MQTFSLLHKNRKKGQYALCGVPIILLNVVTLGPKSATATETLAAHLPSTVHLTQITTQCTPPQKQKPQRTNALIFIQP